MGGGGEEGLGGGGRKWVAELRVDWVEGERKRRVVEEREDWVKGREATGGGGEGGLGGGGGSDGWWREEDWVEGRKRLAEEERAEEERAEAGAEGRACGGSGVRSGGGSYGTARAYHKQSEQKYAKAEVRHMSRSSSCAHTGEEALQQLDTRKYEDIDLHSLLILHTAGQG
ncbi:hypothetical protein CYMTET_50200 [Cymbomonas tetramitiformis]|uniref:Uncharacterized protein n=1 Tax=Cymbomonas tetramitiformis TaxID=36881 RepID=A0AAE0ETX5_9CHLO|nr:hypothetical protein CYMTET_50200 [Cymbomonas tetramitiformis]